MSRAFFSYASEDIAIVTLVFNAVIDRFPSFQPWLDKYEIVGGEDLLKKIAAGMDSAEKFFVFLSPTSVQKPWLQRELTRAIMREVGGINPDYIVPVRLANLT